MNEYRLWRTIVVDHAGTPRDEALFTTSREVLLREIDASLRRGSFAEDSLDAAWFFTITRHANELEIFQPMSLGIGTRPGRPLFPDFSVRRGEVCIDVEVHHEPRVSFETRGRSFPSLGSLGDSDLVHLLREAPGEVQVQLATERLFASIPDLEPPLRAAPLRFVPFFECERFREYWEEEGQHVDLGIDAFDGHVPFDTWFDLGALETLCSDVDVDPAFA